jgi:hypothetical protein
MGTKQALILAAAIIVAGIAHGIATQVQPQMIVGCQFNSSPTTLGDGNFSPLQCDSSGNLKTKAQ